MAIEINSITNDSGQFITIDQSDSTYTLSPDQSRSPNPQWTLNEGPENPLVLTATSDDESNDLYLWYEMEDNEPHLYQMVPGSGTAGEFKGLTIPMDTFGVHFIVDGNTIIVGTVDTMIDPKRLTLASVMED